MRSPTLSHALFPTHSDLEWVALVLQVESGADGRLPGIDIVEVGQD